MSCTNIFYEVHRYSIMIQVDICLVSILLGQSIASFACKFSLSVLAFCGLVIICRKMLFDQIIKVHLY